MSRVQIKGFFFFFLLQKLYWLYLNKWATFLLRKSSWFFQVESIIWHYNTRSVLFPANFHLESAKIITIDYPNHPSQPTHSAIALLKVPSETDLNFFVYFWKQAIRMSCILMSFLLRLSPDNRPPLIWTNTTTFSYIGLISLCKSL